MAFGTARAVDYWFLPCFVCGYWIAHCVYSCLLWSLFACLGWGRLLAFSTGSVQSSDCVSALSPTRPHRESGSVLGATSMLSVPGRVSKARPVAARKVTQWRAALQQHAVHRRLRNNVGDVVGKHNLPVPARTRNEGVRP